MVQGEDKEKSSKDILDVSKNKIFKDPGKKIAEIRALTSEREVELNKTFDTEKILREVIKKKGKKPKKILRGGVEKNKISLGEIFIIVFSFLLVVIVFMFLFSNGDNGGENIYLCGDSTPDNFCSYRQPYFCENGTLIAKAELCGCPAGLVFQNGICTSEFFYGEKSLSFDYVLRGKKGEIDFVAYGGVVEFLSAFPREINHSKNELPSRREFKLLKLDNGFQREAISPLIAEIQNINSDEIDQVRIAVSLIQHISYGSSGGTVKLSLGSANVEVNVSKYPYEVLYDDEGVCEDKSELLSLILNELGYGVALFYYPDEQHEAVGILCPVEYSLNDTGYCFIETTGPAIISDSDNYYDDQRKLSANFILIPLASGKSLPADMYEYKDAKLKNKIYDDILDDGEVARWDSYTLKNLAEKYDLII